jgi:hypothetical protein
MTVTYLRSIATSKQGFAASGIVVDGIDGICDVSRREKESPAEAGLKTWAFAKRELPL